MGKDKKRSTPKNSPETEAADSFEPYAVVLESIQMLDHKQVVYHHEFNPTCLVLTKPISGEIKKEGQQTIKYARRRLLYKHELGYCDFLLAQEDDDKDSDVLSVPFGFNESNMNGQMTYSGGVSLPWPSTLQANYNPKKTRLVDYINTDPETRNISDTLLMVYKRICWLFYNSAQSDPKLAKDVESERDAMKFLNCPINPPTYKEDQADGHKMGQFNFTYTPRMYLKIDAYPDKKESGKMNVSSKFYDTKDEEVDIMTRLTQSAKVAPVIIFKGIFSGAKSSIQSSLFEANKVSFSAKTGGGRERVLRPKIKTADEVASTSQFDSTPAEEEVPTRRKDRKKRQEADEEF